MNAAAIWSNCQSATLYLLLRGEVKEIRIVVSDAPGWLYTLAMVTKIHYTILTRRNHLVHFRHIRDHQYNPYGAWWFIGSIKGLSRRHPERSKVLNRRVILRVPPIIALCFFAMVYQVLFFPWSIVWLCYPPLWKVAYFPPAWGAYWIYEALTKRLSK